MTYEQSVKREAIRAAMTMTPADVLDLCEQLEWLAHEKEDGQ